MCASSRWCSEAYSAASPDDRGEWYGSFSQRVEKIKLLIVTDGSNGFEIRNDKTKQVFDIEKIKAKDTIGAGDTFFTAFSIKYYQTREITESAHFAQETVKEFLLKK